ncbi:MAG: hypothetical protein IT308_13525 [Anaerolineaceae bacterium]|nr:hypothetical protein [Anaerolineaceae bacterium]
MIRFIAWGLAGAWLNPATSTHYTCWPDNPERKAQDLRLVFGLHPAI